MKLDFLVSIWARTETALPISADTSLASACSFSFV